MSTPGLLGVLVTFRRAQDLERTLAALAAQERRIDRLVVVDNDPTSVGEQIVRAAADAAGSVIYRPMAENVGFAGGLAAGMDALLIDAADDDWIVVLDDDDPPDTSLVLGELYRFAQEMFARDPRTAAVGLRGARFDWRRGLLSRVGTRELDPAVAVDCIAGNALPMYRVAAVRTAGTFFGPLFFSHEELELGLRLKDAGCVLYADGRQWSHRRERNERPDVVSEGRFKLLQPNWRSYYSLRNAIFILRAHGRHGTAMKVSISRGLVKPLLNIPVSPRMAVRALRVNRKACTDAWRGRLGRRVEPDMNTPRPKKALAAR